MASVSLNPFDCTMTVFLGCLNGDVEYLLVYWSQLLECLKYGPNLFFNISMGNFVLFCYLLQLECSIILISFIVPEFFLILSMWFNWLIFLKRFFSPFCPPIVFLQCTIHLIWLYPYFTCCFFIILLSFSPRVF